jgi:D-inositol-3-phosphate glycosyltransferase
MAYAFGRPVVVTDVGSLSEAVIDGRTGRVVPPMDAGKVAEAIAELLLDGEKRLRMGEEASKMARTVLGWENIAALTQEVYEAARESTGREAGSP